MRNWSECSNENHKALLMLNKNYSNAIKLPLFQALRQEERNQKEADRLLAMDERKRPYNSLKGDYRDVTEEDMEAYRLKRRQQDDPMKDFL